MLHSYLGTHNSPPPPTHTHARVRAKTAALTMTRHQHPHSGTIAGGDRAEVPPALSDQVTPFPAPTTTTPTATAAASSRHGKMSYADMAKAPAAATAATAADTSLARDTDSDQQQAAQPQARPAAAATADALSSDTDAPTSINAAAAAAAPHTAAAHSSTPTPTTISSQQQQQQQQQQQRMQEAIRAEQRCQMLQARSKGATTQAQQPQPCKNSSSGVAPVLHGSAEAARLYSKEGGLFLDEAELLAASTFPIAPPRLVEMAKDVLRKGVHKCDNLSSNFQFSAPFIGPLSREDFAGVMVTLDLDAVFPDMSPRVHDLRVDPLQPNRVWFTTRPIGINSGFLTAKLPVPQPPTYRTVELPPQTSSLSFNEAGEVVDFTMGYVMDRRIGNSGGLGGAFGFLWALGVPLPYPEGKPWTASWQQQLFNSGGRLLQGAMFVLDRLSTALLPAWLTSRHNRANP